MLRTTSSLNCFAGASLVKAYAISAAVNLGLLAALAGMRPGGEAQDAVLLSRWGQSVVEVTIASAAGSPGDVGEDEEVTVEPVVIEPTQARVAERTFHYAPAADPAMIEPGISAPLASAPPVRADLADGASTGDGPSLPDALARLPRATSAHRPGSGAVDSLPAVPGSETGSPDFSGNPPPAYPAQSLALREEGTVTLRLSIDESGRVTTVELVQSSGYARLDTAAVNAARKYRGQPARRDGRPVAVVRRMEFRFYLD